MSDFRAKPILCLDFDGVIHRYDSKWTDAKTISDGPVDGALEFIRAAQEHFHISIFSSRSGTAEGRLAMFQWLKKHASEMWGEREAFLVLIGVEFPHEKPPAFISIDDRVMCFEGLFPDPRALLGFKPWNKRDNVSSRTFPGNALTETSSQGGSGHAHATRQADRGSGEGSGGRGSVLGNQVALRRNDGASAGAGAPILPELRAGSPSGVSGEAGARASFQGQDLRGSGEAAEVLAGHGLPGSGELREGAGPALEISSDQGLPWSGQERGNFSGRNRVENPPIEAASQNRHPDAADHSPDCAFANDLAQARKCTCGHAFSQATFAAYPDFANTRPAYRPAYEPGHGLGTLKEDRSAA
jgi:hypothetical protein